MAESPDPPAGAAAGRLLALGALVPGVVHELNNALLGLLGMIELAQADAQPKVAERLAIAQDAGEEIRDIARILGALAREPLDRQEHVPLQDVVRDTVETARTLNLVRGLELVEVYGDKAAPVAGSVAQLRHALLLLLGAAFDGSGREGQLLVECGVEHGRARFSVRHAGAGSIEAGDPGLARVATLAAELGGELVRANGSLTLLLPLAA